MTNGAGIVGDFSTPDFFADEAITFDFVNDTIRITFAVAKAQSPVEGSPQALVATGRLIMPLGSAQRLSLSLHDCLIKRGLDPSAAVRGDEKTQ